MQNFQKIAFSWIFHRIDRQTSKLQVSKRMLGVTRRRIYDGNKKAKSEEPEVKRISAIWIKTL
jgi:hypothetical protein